MNEINSNSSINYFFEELPNTTEQKRTALLSLPIFQPRYMNFAQTSFHGRNVQHLQENPLCELKEKLKANDHFGAHFHGLGKGLVKSANLCFRTQVIDGKVLTELDFKINHVFRTSLQETIDQLSSMDKHVLRAILNRTESHGKDIRIERNQPFPLGQETMGNATKITMDGLGTIFIGSSSDIPTLYNRVVVRMDADKTINDFHELLSFFHLDASFQISTSDDIERLKIGHLFRVFYPKEALAFERSEAFFFNPIEQIKAQITEFVPEMEAIFDTYLNQMTPGEILPGKMRYRIKGLAQKTFEHGARALTAAITGGYSNRVLFERIGSILRTGMMSSETRISFGNGDRGMSTWEDFASGGADSVFTQMISENHCKKGTKLSSFHYNSDVRLIISLDALETGTYQYLNDKFGNRCMNDRWDNSYSLRPGILNFIDRLQKNTPMNEELNDLFIDKFYMGNEVMVKERIDPSFFKKIIVSNSGKRQELITYLDQNNLIQDNRILGHLVDEFIVVENTVTERLFT